MSEESFDRKVLAAYHLAEMAIEKSEETAKKIDELEAELDRREADDG